MGLERSGALPVVAVVGRPNVGKSSLVNRVLGRREAIVDPTPGVTRDRVSAIADWGGRHFEIVDTGGLELGPSGLEADIAEQAQVAVQAADLIVLVVDATVGVTEEDAGVARLLRRENKPVILAANKVDDARSEIGAADFYGLGLGDPVVVSALHGRGSGDLLDLVVRRLPPRAPSPHHEWAAMAIVGRPNVGKSSLLNALSGEGRAIVSASPGTTRDPVDARLRMPDGEVLRLVDTAGMRRQVRIADPIEYFSWLRSRRTLHRVDVAALVVDVTDGVTGHDQRIAEEIATTGRACVVCLNKWDLAPGDERDRRRLERDIEDKLRFVRWAARVRTSAVTKRGLDRLLPAVDEAVESHRRRITTARLNQILQRAQEERPHPRTRGRPVRILYAAQTAVAPPTFVVFATGRLEETYVRHLERRIRAEEPWPGAPLRLEPRIRSRPKVEG